MDVQGWARAVLGWESDAHCKVFVALTLTVVSSAFLSNKYFGSSNTERGECLWRVLAALPQDSSCIQKANDTWENCFPSMCFFS